jgi:hypothetical protein
MEGSRWTELVMPFGWIDFVKDVRWQLFAQLIRRSDLDADTSDKIIDSGILIIILTTDGSGKSTTRASGMQRPDCSDRCQIV